MRVNTHLRGSGPDLLLLHGIGHRWQAWEPVLDLLAAHHRVIAVDVPGFGLSPVPEGGMPPSMPATVDAMAQWLAEQGIDRPHVAGNSMGGAIALELAAQGLVSSATALSPAGFSTPAEVRRALRILSSMRANTFVPTPVMRAALRTSLVQRMSFGPLVVHTGRLTHDRAVGDALALRRGKGFRPVARIGLGYAFTGRPSVPVTVAWAQRDRIFPIGHAQRARDLLPGARHVTLPGCGHVPMSDEPELVASVILQTTGAVRT